VFGSTAELASGFVTAIGFSKSESAGAEASDDKDPYVEVVFDFLSMYLFLFNFLLRIEVGANANDDSVLENRAVMQPMIVLEIEIFMVDILVQGNY